MTLPGPARRVLLASLIGSAIEWFDFFLYGTAAALVFNKLFFPAADPLVSIGAALIGGTAPLVATLLLSADHGRWRWIAVYIVVIALISVIAVTRGVERSGTARAAPNAA